MKFQVLDIVPHGPHPVTGELLDPSTRLERVVETAVLAEELGLDAFAVGERHAGDFLSSSPTVLLGALAQATDRILLSTGVTVLSLLDPVRVAEDYATIDLLSRGRLEIVIGKGNEDKHFPLFGLELEHQYDYLEENYELLTLLLSQEHVDWQGTFHAPLTDATTLPRPYDGPFRIWHGSATSTIAVDLAAKHGDPIVSANALQPRENYKVLIDRYREQLVGARPRPVGRLRRLRLGRPVPRRHHRAGDRGVPRGLRGLRGPDGGPARRRDAPGQGLVVHAHRGRGRARAGARRLPGARRGEDPRLPRLLPARPAVGLAQPGAAVRAAAGRAAPVRRGGRPAGPGRGVDDAVGTAGRGSRPRPRPPRGAV